MKHDSRPTDRSSPLLVNDESRLKAPSEKADTDFPAKSRDRQRF
jgi:hypothetical protein